MKTKRFRLPAAAVALAAVVLLIVYIIYPERTARGLVITYPFENTVFPADIASQTFVWNDIEQETGEWLIEAESGGKPLAGPLKVREKYWQPTPEEWAALKAAGVEEKIMVTVSRNL